MQFCTLLLRPYSNSGLVSSAFSRKGDDSSRWVEARWSPKRLMGVLTFLWYYYSMRPGVISFLEAVAVSGHGVSPLKGPHQLLYLK